MPRSNRILQTCLISLLVIFVVTFWLPYVHAGGKDKDNIIILGGGHGGGHGGHGGMPLILITGGGKSKKGEQTILVSLIYDTCNLIGKKNFL